jgi:hypothetical protein
MVYWSFLCMPQDEIDGTASPCSWPPLFMLYVAYYHDIGGRNLRSFSDSGAFWRTLTIEYMAFKFVDSCFAKFLTLYLPPTVVFVLHISSSELPVSATDRGKVYSPYYFVLDLRLNIMIAHVVAIEFAVVIRLAIYRAHKKNFVWGLEMISPTHQAYSSHVQREKD